MSTDPPGGIDPVPPAPSSAQGLPPRQSHPRGLTTLFFTEMWERFSYYGMRALLVLFMVDAAKGGMGMSDKTATAIYGIYTAAVYLVALPGGWVADRILGAQRSVWWGGVVIALGHFTLAVPSDEAFYAGLVLVMIGTGLLKPNMSALVGELYPEGGARRDAGFTIYYMGVNLGAALGPIICALLAEEIDWHYGFAAAGVGMVFGLIQFALTRQWLGEAGLHPGSNAPLSVVERTGLFGGMALTVAVCGLLVAGVIPFDAVAVARHMRTVIVAIAVLYFAYIFLFGGLSRIENQRVAVIVVLFLGCALFWAGFEQAGSSFNLFAERYTDRELSWFDFTVPAGWFQSVNPVLIITFAPLFAAFWVRLARRNLNPSIPAKFALGLLLLAAGFAVMAGAAKVVADGYQALPTWLIITYLLHTFGELCLSPVGLSSVSKLAPKHLTGQMMGIWFLATSLGNLIAGLLAGEFDAENLPQWPDMYLHIALWPAIGGVLLLVLAKPISRWTGGIR